MDPDATFARMSQAFPDFGSGVINHLELECLGGGRIKSDVNYASSWRHERGARDWRSQPAATHDGLPKMGKTASRRPQRFDVLYPGLAGQKQGVSP